MRSTAHDCTSYLSATVRPFPADGGQTESRRMVVFFKRAPRKQNAGTCALLLSLCILFGARVAAAQQLSLQLESEAVYANVPFVLHVIARGFDENPQPTLSKLAISGCRVTPLGVTPQVSSMVQIINGQRSEQRQVTFAFRFQIEAAQAGQYTVPALTAEQGGKRAQSSQARFVVRAVDDTRDMQLRLLLPERPLWVGETVDAVLEWYLRRDVANRSFSVPLFEKEEWLEVEAPPGEPRLGGFRSGSRPLELPYEQDKATLDGTPYTRFRFQFRYTPNKSGTLTLPPARVVAELQTGYERDVFGFAVPRSQLFQAVAKPARLDIRPLPLAERPRSFKNAVGRSFAIEVQAGRTVVRVGDPIELRILLRGKGRLSGLILPELAAMGITEPDFSAPEEAPSGEVLEDGKGKLFRVSVRLRSTNVKEIPALGFGYFDPEEGRYKTVTSQPIALSVKGSAVVGAGDVVSSPQAQGGAPAKMMAQAKEGLPTAPGLSLVGADLALSDERLAVRRAASLRKVWPLVIGLYGAALLLLLFHVVRVRKQAAWQTDTEVKKSLRRVQSELAKTNTEAARDAAPKLCAALRGLRKELTLPEDAGQALLDRLETEAYSPSAAQRPLSEELRRAVAQLVETWERADRRPPQGKRALFTLLFLLSLGPALAQAQDRTAEEKLKQARIAYKKAFEESDRDRRRSGFADAEGTFRELTSTYADCPELLTDWGNAALLAQEPGWAVLAYRRALRLDPTVLRARRNLGFLRERLPDWLPRPRSGPLDSVLFFEPLLPLPQRQIGLAAAVLLSVALLIPWTRRRRRLLRLLSVPALLVAAALLLSLIAERDPARDAVVVVGGKVLRSADSAGAPPAFAHPLPAGAEVGLVESRGEYSRISLSDGQTGWLPTSVLEPIVVGEN